MADEPIDARAAIFSAFRVAADDDGFRITWGDDPLDFVWQTRAQLEHLHMVIGLALDTFPPNGFVQPKDGGVAGEEEKA